MVLTTVSYTHLDVYKRQVLTIHRFRRPRRRSTVHFRSRSSSAMGRSSFPCVPYAGITGRPIFSEPPLVSVSPHRGDVRGILHVASHPAARDGTPFLSLRGGSKFHLAPRFWLPPKRLYGPSARPAPRGPGQRPEPLRTPTCIRIPTPW